MTRLTLLLTALLIATSPVQAMTEDDPLLFMFMADKLEWRDADAGDLWVWDADAWLGKDLNKLWFKTDFR